MRLIPQYMYYVRYIDDGSAWSRPLRTKSAAKAWITREVVRRRNWADSVSASDFDIVCVELREVG